MTTLALASVSPATGGAEHRRPLRGAVGAVRAHRQLQSALLTMALLGVVAGLVPLLVPLVLDENGLSAGEIGVVFSAGAAVWIVASAFVARLGGRAVRIPAAAIGVVGLGLALLLPVVTLATAGVAVFVLLRAATHAPLSTISYPLAEVAAGAAGIGRGTAIGLLNVVWAGAAAVSPILGGALAGAIGAQATFALVAVACGAAGAWMLRGEAEQRERRWLDAQAAR
jgi:MFS family permease